MEKNAGTQRWKKRRDGEVTGDGSSVLTLRLRALALNASTHYKREK